MKFRKLKASEVECRIATVSQNKGFSLLLYKDARCDMNILDETVGEMNWKREHVRDNANCIVSLWDNEKKQWVSKEDTGTESYTEKEKGLASDSFKRACFNWGIGRELYTAPFIWINDSTTTKESVKYKRFKVAEINYGDTGEICNLVIVDNKGKAVFAFNEKNQQQEPEVDYNSKIQSAKTVTELTKIYNTMPASKQADNTIIELIKAKRETLKQTA